MHFSNLRTMSHVAPSLSLINLENELSILLEWFKCNGMVANPKKFQLMFLGLKRKQGLHLNIQGSKIVAKGHVKLLGIEIDNKLKLDKLVQTLCQKVKKKTSAFLG